MSQRKNKKKRQSNSNLKTSGPILNESQKVQQGSQVPEQIKFERKIHQGPLPAPEDLEQYSKIAPDLVDRIVKMAEKQQDHRHKCEVRDQKTIPFLMAFGQVLGFILGAITILGGIFLLYNDKSIEGYSVLIGAVVALGGVFLYNKRRDEKLMEAEPQQEKVPGPR